MEMGDQFNAPIQTLPNPHPQSPNQNLIETQPHSHSDSTPQPQSSRKSPDSDVRIPPPPPPHQPSTSEVSQNPSKIPIRPQKIRKLSIPTPDKPQTTASSAVPLTTTTCSVAPTTPTSAARNRRRSASQASRAVPQVIKPLCADGEVELALRHLRGADPSLIPLIDAYPPPHFDSHISPFVALTKSIIYQQLAYKPGTSIYMRFVALCGNEESVCPDSVLALSSQQLKQIGVSSRKASYLLDLANKYKSGILSDDKVVKMDDRSLFTMLSMVKGIGAWSIHMFMIFSLQRPDVLPVSDLGVRKGVQLLCGLEELPTPSHLEQLCEKWRPYRSVGAWYMWRLVEGKEGLTAASSLPLDGSMMQPLQQIEPHQVGQHQPLQCVEPVNGMGNLG